MKTSRSLNCRTAALATSIILASATALHAQEQVNSLAVTGDVAISGSSASGIGVHGSSGAHTGIGVFGEAVSTNLDATYGVYGKAASITGSGVYGESKNFGVLGRGYHGVKGTTSEVHGNGVIGTSIAVTGEGIGVYGYTQAPDGQGVSGYSAASSGTNYGVYGFAQSPDGFGVFGIGEGTGVYGESNSLTGFGVYGESTAWGVFGKGNYGVTGTTNNTTGRAVFGDTAGQSAYALYGRATGQYGKGLYAVVTSSHSSANAILAESGGGDSYAAYLIGRVHITGALRVMDVPTGDYADMQYNTATGQLFYLTSSKRDKENIQPLDADFTAILKAEPVQYTRPGAPERVEIGYIAEDMEALGLGRLIGYNADGQVETFNYKKMIVYVVEVLKDQQQTIERLQAEVERLGSREEATAR